MTSSAEVEVSSKLDLSSSLDLALASLANSVQQASLEMNTRLDFTGMAKMRGLI
jgi:uncharacterized protein YajQ (UPF0234 family)